MLVCLSVDYFTLDKCVSVCECVCLSKRKKKNLRWRIGHSSVEDFSFDQRTCSAWAVHTDATVASDAASLDHTYTHTHTHTLAHTLAHKSSASIASDTAHAHRTYVKIFICMNTYIYIYIHLCSYKYMYYICIYV